MTRDQALKAVIPFGTHKGKTLGDLVNAESDELRSYLDWLKGLPDIKSKYFRDALDSLDGDDGVEDQPEEDGW